MQTKQPKTSRLPELHEHSNINQRRQEDHRKEEVEPGPVGQHILPADDAAPAVGLPASTDLGNFMSAVCCAQGSEGGSL